MSGNVSAGFSEPTRLWVTTATARSPRCRARDRPAATRRGGGTASAPRAPAEQGSGAIRSMPEAERHPATPAGRPRPAKNAARRFDDGRRRTVAPGDAGTPATRFPRPAWSTKARRLRPGGRVLGEEGGEPRADGATLHARRRLRARRFAPLVVAQAACPSSPPTASRRIGPPIPKKTGRRGGSCRLSPIRATTPPAAAPAAARDPAGAGRNRRRATRRAGPLEPATT